MACKEQEKILAFDTIFSNNHIQMLKIMLPFMDRQMQKFMAVYIKFLELRYTIDFCKRTAFSLQEGIKQEGPFSPLLIFDELLPLCNMQEKKQLEQMRSVFQNMEMYQEMSKTMEMMKDFMPDMGDFFRTMQNTGDSSANTPNSGFSMSDMLMNMMTPEQKEMYELFKGDDTHAKRMDEG